MLPNRFVITELDFSADCGTVRHVSAPIGSLLPVPVSFVISQVTQAYFDEEDSGYGIRIPDQATKNRTPVIGEELAGAIAADHNGTVFDLNGNPFLRNWVYADQYEAIMTGVQASTTDESDDYDDSSDDEPDRDEEECPGGCGQPAYACTCDELASWNRYLATPMEERDGIWTA